MSGLKDAYGDNLPAELTGQCNQKAFLRIEDPDTAQWAAKCIGDEDLRERNRSFSEGGSADGDNSWNRTVDERLSTRPTVMPDEIRTLPPTNERNGLSGYYTCPQYGAWRYTHPGEVLAEALLAPESNVPDFIPRNAPQTIALWAEADLARLNLTFLPLAPVVSPRPGTKAPANGAAASNQGHVASSRAAERPNHSIWSVGRVTPPPHQTAVEPSNRPA
jgi:hypothetical protein